MPKPKYDGVVVAVRYAPDGRVGWVRAYTRRGPTFSDHVMIRRDDLVDMIKAGKRFVVGQRIALMASTFEVGEAVRVIQSEDQEILISGANSSKQDRLEGVPIL